MFLLQILKDLLDLHYKGKSETELRNFLFALLFFQGLQHDICQCWWHHSLKHNLAIEFFRNKNKEISILTESHINRDQIHHMINNWLDPVFFCSGDSHTEELLVLLHPGLDSSEFG